MASARKTEKQNIEFMELYKAVDAFIKNRFGTEDGASEYIRRLEKVLGGAAQNKTRQSGTAEDARQDFRMLKHLRWVRNMLAHEASYTTQLLKEGDMEWLEDFYRKLRRSADTLSLMKKSGSSEKGRDKKPAKLSLAGRIKRFLFG